jgi:hypothetical protein
MAAGTVSAQATIRLITIASLRKVSLFIVSSFVFRKPPIRLGVRKGHPSLPIYKAITVPMLPFVSY